MDTVELNKRLLGVGEKIKAKGWQGARIDIYISYLAVFDEQSILDPMIFYRPSIRASTQDYRGAFSTHEFVEYARDIKTLEDAIQKLETAANQMQTMAAKIALIEEAKAKLSDDERRLLGVR